MVQAIISSPIQYQGNDESFVINLLDSMGVFTRFGNTFTIEGYTFEVDGGVLTGGFVFSSNVSGDATAWTVNHPDVKGVAVKDSSESFFYGMVKIRSRWYITKGTEVAIDEPFPVSLVNGTLSADDNFTSTASFFQGEGNIVGQTETDGTNYYFGFSGPFGVEYNYTPPAPPPAAPTNSLAEISGPIAHTWEDAATAQAFVTAQLQLVGYAVDGNTFTNEMGSFELVDMSDILLQGASFPVSIDSDFQLYRIRHNRMLGVLLVQDGISQFMGLVQAGGSAHIVNADFTQANDGNGAVAISLSGKFLVLGAASTSDSFTTGTGDIGDTLTVGSEAFFDFGSYGIEIEPPPPPPDQSVLNIDASPARPLLGLVGAILVHSAYYANNNYTISPGGEAVTGSNQGNWPTHLDNWLIRFAPRIGVGKVQDPTKISNLQILKAAIRLHNAGFLEIPQQELTVKLGKYIPGIQELGTIGLRNLTSDASTILMALNIEAADELNSGVYSTVVNSAFLSKYSITWEEMLAALNVYGEGSDKALGVTDITESISFSDSLGLAVTWLKELDLTAATLTDIVELQPVLSDLEYLAIALDHQGLWNQNPGTLDLGVLQTYYKMTFPDIVAGMRGLTTEKIISDWGLATIALTWLKAVTPIPPLEVSSIIHTTAGRLLYAVRGQGAVPTSITLEEWLALNPGWQSSTFFESMSRLTSYVTYSGTGGFIRWYGF